MNKSTNGNTGLSPRDDIGDIALRLWTRKGEIGDLADLLRQRVREAYEQGKRDAAIFDDSKMSVEAQLKMREEMKEEKG